MKSKSNASLVKARFLADIAALQETTAPVDLSIGATIGGYVHSEYIAIKDAPQTIVTAVTNLAGKYGLTFSLKNGGLMVGFENANEMSREEFFK